MLSDGGLHDGAREGSALWSPPYPGAAGSTSLYAGETYRADRHGGLRVIQSGWLCRSRVLRDGRRQILELMLPGEFVPSSDESCPDDVISALSPCVLVGAPSSGREREDMLASTARRRNAILKEHVVRLGQRSALERTGHLFCELAARLGSDGAEEGFALPMTQVDLSDLLGLSIVHTNRMMQTLRRLGLAEVKRGRLRMLDHDGLADLAGFSPAYLA